MHARCRGEHTGTEHYPTKGITICPEWETFEGFLADMGHAPEGLSLDRIDNDKGYSKENCRWATPKEQCVNRSITNFITHNGVTMCARDWSRSLGDKSGTLVSARIHSLGWSPEKAVTTPKQKYTRRAA